MLDFLHAVLSCSVIGIGCGLFTIFFSFIIGEPHLERVNTRRVFSWYGVWIRQQHDELEDRIQKIATREGMSYATRPDKGLEREYAARPNWWKAAGVCPYCSNPWITLALSIPSLFLFDVNFFFLFLVISASHTTVGYMISS